MHALLIPSYRSIDGFGLVDQAALVPVPNLVPETGWFAGAGLGGALDDFGYLDWFGAWV